MLLMFSRWKTSAQEIDLREPVPTQQWLVMKRQALRLMKARMCFNGSLVRLDETPYELWTATNGFGDKFHILRYETNIEGYTEMERELARNDYLHNYAFPDICAAFDEVLSKQAPLRFIVSDLNMQEGVEAVVAPRLRTTSEVVGAALRDTETLIRASGVPNAIDRAHTTFHGYLKEICDTEGIVVADDSDITTLFAQLREQHPRLRISDPRTDKMTVNILRGFARAIDALNPIRNNKSLAHPNTLLDPPEAMLVLNAI